MSQLKLITKKGCPFCDILKAQLDDLKVPYDYEIDKFADIVPVLQDSRTGRVLHEGLPKRKKLLDIIKEFK